jgi:polyisoprenoid-binding protein YceI
MVDLAADQARLRVYVFRRGALAAVGHDLQLDARLLTLAVDGLRVRAECRLEALEVAGAIKGGALDAAAFSAQEKREIQENMRRQVLQIDRFPTAVYEGVGTEDGGGYLIRGSLSLHGVKRELEARVRPRGPDLVAELTVDQPSFGIKPFKALLGALKVADEVKVEVVVPRRDAIS